jgi:hypothetical protein
LIKTGINKVREYGINKVREYRRGNQKFALQRNWNPRVHKRKTNKTNFE